MDVKLPTSDNEVLEYKNRIQGLLERMWKAYNARTDTLGYNLVILAIPKFPASIEAVSRNLDVETLVEVLEAFLTQFKENRAHGDRTDHEPAPELAADAPAEAPSEGSTGSGD